MVSTFYVVPAISDAYSVSILSGYPPLKSQRCIVSKKQGTFHIQNQKFCFISRTYFFGLTHYLAEKRLFPLSKIKRDQVSSRLEIGQNFETLEISFTIADPLYLMTNMDFQNFHFSIFSV